MFANLVILIIIIVLGIRYYIEIKRRNYLVKLNSNWNFDEINKEIAKRESPKLTDVRIEKDKPVPFGFKSCWFAVKTNDFDLIIDTLDLKSLSESNWESGIKLSYGDSNFTFITPSIGAWKLIVGSCLEYGNSEKSADWVISNLNKLSKVFGEAQFFATHRVVEFHCWAKSMNGILDRYYSYLGERNENIKVFGNSSDIEKGMNLVNTFSEAASNESYFDDESLVFPDEDLVMKIAGSWSINPTKLLEYPINENEMGRIVNWKVV